MGYFDNFSPRARRTIYFAFVEAARDRAKEIGAEHVLRGLLREDPQLFSVVAPEIPDLVNKLQTEYGDKSAAPLPQSLTDYVPLSAEGKDVVARSHAEYKRLGHRQVATQHLLLPILTCKVQRPWYSRRKPQAHSRAQEVLIRHGLSATAVEARTEEGIVTPSNWGADDLLIQLNGQLNSLAELLIAKGVFCRSEFVELIEKN